MTQGHDTVTFMSQGHDTVTFDTMHDDVTARGGGQFALIESAYFKSGAGAGTASAPPLCPNMF